MPSPVADRMFRLSKPMNTRDTAQESTQMSEVPPAIAETLHVDQDADLMPREDVVPRPTPPRVEVEVSPAPTLITEQEVVFGTKAAAAARHTRWWTGAVSIVAWRRAGSSCLHRRTHGQRGDTIHRDTAISNTPGWNAKCT